MIVIRASRLDKAAALATARTDKRKGFMMERMMKEKPGCLPAFIDRLEGLELGFCNHG